PRSQVQEQWSGVTGGNASQSQFRVAVRGPFALRCSRSPRTAPNADGMGLWPPPGPMKDHLLANKAPKSSLLSSSSDDVLRLRVPADRTLLPVRGDRHLTRNRRAEPQLKGTNRFFAAAHALEEILH